MIRYLGALAIAALLTASAWGQAPFLLRNDPPAGGAFSTYVQTDNPAAQATPGTTTVTFTAVNIGAAASNRVVVLVFSSAVNVASAVTVGVVSMAKAIEESTAVSGLQIWYGTVPSGATANVVLTFPAAPQNCMLVAGKFNSGASTAPAGTPQSVANGAGASTQTLNTTISSGGFAVMGVVQGLNSQTPTWTNMTSSSGDIVQTIGSFNTIYTAHSTTSGSPTALGFSVPTSGPIHSVSAAWGP